MSFFVKIGGEREYLSRRATDEDDESRVEVTEGGLRVVKATGKTIHCTVHRNTIGRQKTG